MIVIPSPTKDHRDSGPVSATRSGTPMPKAAFARQPRPSCRGFHTGPHNRCQSPTRFPASRHRTAEPAGHVRCQGEPGCAFRIPAHWPIHLCAWHRDQRWDHDWRTEQLMGAKPEPSVGRIAG